MKNDNNIEMSLDQLDSVAGGKSRCTTDVYWDPYCPDCRSMNLTRTGNTRPGNTRPEYVKYNCSRDDFECKCNQCKRVFWWNEHGFMLW